MHSLQPTPRWLSLPGDHPALHHDHQPHSQGPTPLLLHPREPRFSHPVCYTGEVGRCWGFIVQCELIFEQQPRCYATERARIAFIVSSLGGRALEWATAVWDAEGPAGYHYETFMEEFRSVFDHPEGGWIPLRLRFSRGRVVVADYAVDFRTLAAEVRWN